MPETPSPRSLRPILQPSGPGGYNGHGQLGDWTTTDSDSHTQESTESTNWSAIDGGGRDTVALKSDGTLWSWGHSDDRGEGPFGDFIFGGINFTDRYTPIQIGSATNWSAIAAGGFHTVALKAGGTLWAWGYNYYGQLGDGTQTNRHTPTQ